MGLRPVNCLFIDDNVVNLNEAQFYSKDLMIAGPSYIEELVSFCKNTEVSDSSHKRLKQYKVLEQKQKAKAEAGDNLQFLYASNTQVSIHEDCVENADRIFELINRTNQLNYTKFRCTRDELDIILNDPNVHCGYVTVKDNFGDYGIVGFFAIKEGQCIHFLFSCRTIGQGVEQWVYSTLGCPKLEVVGEVVNNVEKIPAPEWINQNRLLQIREDTRMATKIVFKGPCDLELLASFLESSNIICEFTYIGRNRKNSIEHQNHSLNYLSFPKLTQSQREVFTEDCVFNDEEMYDSQMYDDDVSLVFLSTLIEGNLGVYKRKRDGFRFAFGEWTYPLTEKCNWGKYVNGELTTYGNTFTKQWLEHFSFDYEYEGRLNPVEVLENLKSVLKQIRPYTHLCLILGSEIPYEKNKQRSYECREQYHRELNSLIREWAKNESRVHILDLNKYIKSQDDFLHNINHFQRRVYYDASKDANIIIRECTGIAVQEKGKISLLRSNIKAYCIEILKKQPKMMAFIQRIKRSIYRR